jgi:hypothetical protein
VDVHPIPALLVRLLAFVSDHIPVPVAPDDHDLITLDEGPTPAMQPPPVAVRAPLWLVDRYKMGTPCRTLGM